MNLEFSFLNFETSSNEMVLVKVGISAISAENALQNAIKKSKQDVKLPAKRLIKQDKKFDFVKGNHFINSIDSADIRDVMFRAQGDLSAAREELLQAHTCFKK